MCVKTGLDSNLTLTPRSLRRGVRAGAMGVRLLGGLNMLGAVGFLNGALGIPFSGAVIQIRSNYKIRHDNNIQY